MDCDYSVTGKWLRDEEGLKKIFRKDVRGSEKTELSGILAKFKQNIQQGHVVLLYPKETNIVDWVSHVENVNKPEDFLYGYYLNEKAFPFYRGTFFYTEMDSTKWNSLSNSEKNKWYLIGVYPKSCIGEHSCKVTHEFLQDPNKEEECKLKGGVETDVCTKLALLRQQANAAFIIFNDVNPEDALKQYFVHLYPNYKSNKFVASNCAKRLNYKYVYAMYNEINENFGGVDRLGWFNKVSDRTQLYPSPLGEFQFTNDQLYLPVLSEKGKIEMNTRKRLNLYQTACEMRGNVEIKKLRLVDAVVTNLKEKLAQNVYILDKKINKTRETIQKNAYAYENEPIEAKKQQILSDNKKLANQLSELAEKKTLEKLKNAQRVKKLGSVIQLLKTKNQKLKIQEYENIFDGFTKYIVGNLPVLDKNVNEILTNFEENTKIIGSEEIPIEKPVEPKKVEEDYTGAFGGGKDVFTGSNMFPSNECVVETDSQQWCKLTPENKCKINLPVLVTFENIVNVVKWYHNAKPTTGWVWKSENSQNVQIGKYNVRVTYPELRLIFTLLALNLIDPNYVIERRKKGIKNVYQERFAMMRRDLRKKSQLSGSVAPELDRPINNLYLWKLLEYKEKEIPFDEMTGIAKEELTETEEMHIAQRQALHDKFMELYKNIQKDIIIHYENFQNYPEDKNKNKQLYYALSDMITNLLENKLFHALLQDPTQTYKTLTDELVQKRKSICHLVGTCTFKPRPGTFYGDKSNSTDRKDYDIPSVSSTAFIPTKFKNGTTLYKSTTSIEKIISSLDNPELLKQPTTGWVPFCCKKSLKLAFKRTIWFRRVVMWLKIKDEKDAKKDIKNLDMPNVWKERILDTHTQGYLELLQYISSLNIGGKFESQIVKWLFTTIQNMIVNYLKKGIENAAQSATDLERGLEIQSKPIPEDVEKERVIEILQENTADVIQKVAEKKSGQKIDKLITATRPSVQTGGGVGDVLGWLWWGLSSLVGGAANWIVFPAFKGIWWLFKWLARKGWDFLWYAVAHPTTVMWIIRTALWLKQGVCWFISRAMFGKPEGIQVGIFERVTDFGWMWDKVQNVAPHILLSGLQVWFDKFFDETITGLFTGITGIIASLLSKITGLLGFGTGNDGNIVANLLQPMLGPFKETAQGFLKMLMLKEAFVDFKSIFTEPCIVRPEPPRIATIDGTVAEIKNTLSYLTTREGLKGAFAELALMTARTADRINYWSGVVNPLSWGSWALGKATGSKTLIAIGGGDLGDSEFTAAIEKATVNWRKAGIEGKSDIEYVDLMKRKQQSDLNLQELGTKIKNEYDKLLRNPTNMKDMISLAESIVKYYEDMLQHLMQFKVRANRYEQNKSKRMIQIYTTKSEIEAGQFAQKQISIVQDKERLKKLQQLQIIFDKKDQQTQNLASDLGYDVNEEEILAKVQGEIDRLEPQTDAQTIENINKQLQTNRLLLESEKKHKQFLEHEYKYLYDEMHEMQKMLNCMKIMYYNLAIYHMKRQYAYEQVVKSLVAMWQQRNPEDVVFKDKSIIENVAQMDIASFKTTFGKYLGTLENQFYPEILAAEELRNLAEYNLRNLINSEWYRYWIELFMSYFYYFMETAKDVMIAVQEKTTATLGNIRDYFARPIQDLPKDQVDEEGKVLPVGTKNTDKIGLDIWKKLREYARRAFNFQLRGIKTGTKALSITQEEKVKETEEKMIDEEVGRGINTLYETTIEKLKAKTKLLTDGLETINKQLITETNFLVVYSSMWINALDDAQKTIDIDIQWDQKTFNENMASKQGKQGQQNFDTYWQRIKDHKEAFSQIRQNSGKIDEKKRSTEILRAFQTILSNVQSESITRIKQMLQKLSIEIFMDTETVVNTNLDGDGLNLDARVFYIMLKDLFEKLGDKIYKNIVEYEGILSAMEMRKWLYTSILRPQDVKEEFRTVCTGVKETDMLYTINDQVQNIVDNSVSPEPPAEFVKQLQGGGSKHNFANINFADPRVQQMLQQSMYMANSHVANSHMSVPNSHMSVPNNRMSAPNNRMSAPNNRMGSQHNKYKIGGNPIGGNPIHLENLFNQFQSQSVHRQISDPLFEDDSSLYMNTKKRSNNWRF